MKKFKMGGAEQGNQGLQQDFWKQKKSHEETGNLDIIQLLKRMTRSRWIIFHDFFFEGFGFRGLCLGVDTTPRFAQWSLIIDPTRWCSGSEIRDRVFQRCCREMTVRKPYSMNICLRPSKDEVSFFSLLCLSVPSDIKLSQKKCHPIHDQFYCLLTSGSSFLTIVTLKLSLILALHDSLKRHGFNFQIIRQLLHQRVTHVREANRVLWDVLNYAAGLFRENGPCNIKLDTTGFEANPHSWHENVENNCHFSFAYLDLSCTHLFFQPSRRQTCGLHGRTSFSSGSEQLRWRMHLILNHRYFFIFLEST
ncbi:hypothetical protein VP01_627g2 [Puccinia sorghi]|uniref:Uncharacterized protein n=1 Tax=Puccinia sorghi TaxID=27349 RepID=A0A0L6UGD1_9BASI|nr:hypothetical protein VP01_627g2 [Puccinia sorghi]